MALPLIETQERTFWFSMGDTGRVNYRLRLQPILPLVPCHDVGREARIGHGVG
jgi:hypothetical protein